MNSEIKCTECENTWLAAYGAACPRCGRSMPAPSGSAETCDACDYWTLRGVATSPTAVYGYCDLFHKLTKSKHGLQCTGWAPRNPPNTSVSDGPADANRPTSSEEGPFAARNG